MKITRRDNNRIDFIDLPIGAIFIDENDDIAMKIDEIYTDPMGTFNGVYLDNGALGCFEYKEEVREVNAELIVE